MGRHIPQLPTANIQGAQYHPADEPIGATRVGIRVPAVERGGFPGGRNSRRKSRRAESRRRTTPEGGGFCGTPVVNVARPGELNSESGTPFIDSFESNGLLDSSCKTQTKAEKPLTQKQPFVHYSLEFSFDALFNKKSIYKEKTPLPDISPSLSLLSPQPLVLEEDQKFI